MKLQIADLYAAKRLKMSREDRKVDGLINILRKIADDLDSGAAIEGDFDINIEEGENLDAIDITLTSFHIKPEVKKNILLTSDNAVQAIKKLKRVDKH